MSLFFSKLLFSNSEMSFLRIFPHCQTASLICMLGQICFQPWSISGNENLHDEGDVTVIWDLRQVSLSSSSSRNAYGSKAHILNLAIYSLGLLPLSHVIVTLRPACNITANGTTLHMESNSLEKVRCPSSRHEQPLPHFTERLLPPPLPMV